MADLLETFPCAPSIERGRGILISGDPKSNSILYTNGRSVILRYLDNPLHVDVYDEHGYPVTVTRYSPNGEWIASADVSGIVRIWGTHNGFVLHNEFRVLSGRIDDLQWSFDGLRIVACGEGKGKSFVRAFMWDSASTVGDFDGHSKQVLSCAFKPTRPFRIVTGGEDFMVNFYQGPPFKFMLSHRFSPDGNKCISVSSDKKGVIYDGKTGEIIGNLSKENGHTSSIYAVSWSPDSKKVLTVSADKSAKIWEISENGSGSVIKTLERSTSGGVDDMLVGCLWQNDNIVIVSLGGVIHLYSASDLDKSPVLLSGHMKNINALTVIQSNPKVILTSSYDGLILKWRQGQGYIGRIERKLNAKVKCLAAVEQAIMCCGFDNKVHRIPQNRDECGEAEEVDIGILPLDVSIVVDSPELSMVSTELGVVLMKGLDVVSKIDLGFAVSSSAISPDGTEAIVGSQDGKLRIYSISGEAFNETTVLEKHRGPISVIRYSPDVSMFASGDLNREAIVWDQASKEVKLDKMLYHTARINCLAWSPNSSMVATDLDYQGSDILTVVAWMIAQVSQVDVAVALYSWARNLLPFLNESPSDLRLRENILEIAEHILNPQNNRSVLKSSTLKNGESLIPPSSLEALIRLAYHPSSATGDDIDDFLFCLVTERFRDIYHTLIDIALAGNITVQEPLQILSFAAKAAGESKETHLTSFIT